jgi:hypothetical protein
MPRAEVEQLCGIPILFAREANLGLGYAGGVGHYAPSTRLRINSEITSAGVGVFEWIISDIIVPVPIERIFRWGDSARRVDFTLAASSQRVSIPAGQALYRISETLVPSASATTLVEPRWSPRM